MQRFLLVASILIAFALPALAYTYKTTYTDDPS